MNSDLPAHPGLAKPGRRLRLALVQMRVYPGDPQRNAESAIAWLRRAEAEGADLAVFPEMCLPGYLLGDMWERPSFVAECEAQASRLTAATRDLRCAAIFGTVARSLSGAQGEDGRPRKHNAFVFAQSGEAWWHPALNAPYGVKTLHPNYREFDDTRYFYDTRRIAQDAHRLWSDFVVPVSADFRGGAFRLGAHLCEDAWQEDYAQKPLDALAQAGSDLLVNLSASPFTRGKNGKRNRVFGAHADRLALPLVYVNAVSLQNNAKTVYAFDGRSTLYAPGGQIALELPGFQEALGIADLAWNAAGPGHAEVTAAWVLPGATGSSTGTGTAAPANEMAEVHAALRFGLAAFLEQHGLSRVVIGVSGGIDSAVSAALFREILSPEQLLLVNMPSRFNSRTTRDLAEDLARRLGCPYLVLPIDDAVALTETQVDGATARVPGGHPDSAQVTLRLAGLALENAQARDRGARLLAGVAAAFGGVFVCNTNKAEMTVGYGTLYGDIAGFLAPLADLWKADVYALGRYLNESVFAREVIPEGIFQVIPSAELSAAQAVDEGKGDPLVYPYHDRLFFAFVQRWNRATPEEILEAYLSGGLNRDLGLQGVDAYALFSNAAAFIADLEKWWNLYHGLGVVKRLQAPPVLAVSSRAFGFDHRESLLPAFYSTRYAELKAKALARG